MYVKQSSVSAIRGKLDISKILEEFEKKHAKVR